MTENLHRAAERIGLTIPPSTEAQSDSHEQALRQYLMKNSAPGQVASALTVLGFERAHDIVADVIVTAARNERSGVIRRAAKTKVTVTFEEISRLSPTYVIEALELGVIAPLPSVSALTAWLLSHKTSADKIVKTWRHLDPGRLDDNLVTRLFAGLGNGHTGWFNAQDAEERISSAAIAALAVEHPEHLAYVARHSALSEKTLLSAFDAASDWPLRYLLLRVMAQRDLSSAAVGARVRLALDAVRDEGTLPYGFPSNEWVLRHWRTQSLRELTKLLRGTMNAWMSGELTKNAPTAVQLREVLEAQPSTLLTLMNQYRVDKESGAMRQLATKPPIWLLAMLADAMGLGRRLRTHLAESGGTGLGFEKLALLALDYAMRDCSGVVRERLWLSLTAERSLFDSDASFAVIVTTFLEREREAAARVAAKDGAGE